MGRRKEKSAFLIHKDFVKFWCPTPARLQRSTHFFISDSLGQQTNSHLQPDQDQISSFFERLNTCELNCVKNPPSPNNLLQFRVSGVLCFQCHVIPASSSSSLPSLNYLTFPAPYIFIVPRFQFPVCPAS